MPCCACTLPNAYALRAGAPASTSGSGLRLLPRGQALVLGGDLAYPNPSNETYEMRLVRPFEAAMPPPPGVHPGRLVVRKPDLAQPADARAPAACACPPPDCALHCGDGTRDYPSSLPSTSPRCRACAGAAALRAYDGPTAFAIPGNHDWIDGLETFQRYVQHRGWLGGWLLPQEKSYFALRLPHGWWLFGLDLALVDDIDMCQCQYFARIAEERMGPSDQARVSVAYNLHMLRAAACWYASACSAR